MLLVVVQRHASESTAPKLAPVDSGDKYEALDFAQMMALPRVVDPTWANPACDRPGAYLGLPIPLAVVEPYAYVKSEGTFHGWRHERREEMETELPRVLGVDPI